MIEEYKNEPRNANNHIDQIAADTIHAVEDKYLAGQKEHGGKLWRKPVVDFMGEEVTDMIVYFHVLKHQHHKMKQIAAHGLNGGDAAKALKEVFNILSMGNAEGVREDGD